YFCNNTLAFKSRKIDEPLLQYTFGSAGNPSLGIPANTNVEYEVELRDFEKAKEAWEMSQDEKLAQAKLFKLKGTEYFKQEKYRLAIKQYKKVTDYVQYDSGLSNEEKEESHSTLLAGHLNLSMCHLKLKNYMAVKEHATKVLEMDPNNVKAYFRRGQALLNLSDVDEAKNDFEKCLSLDPSNKAALHQVQLCVGKKKQQKQKEKNLYGGMFDKFAKVDAKKAHALKMKNDVMSGDLGEWETDPDRQDKDLGMLDDEYDLKNLENIQMI
ncbi:UNVERIFIED_CONTAM: hypothetical protein GTU68_041537, partial [Idotea baltica]|nr:hypothetical protein [Idotea baltica]